MDLDSALQQHFGFTGFRAGQREACAAALADRDVSNEAFRFFRAQRLFVREVPVVALRLSYVGELGWELYTSADFGRRLWDLLAEAGAFPWGRQKRDQP